MSAMVRLAQVALLAFILQLCGGASMKRRATGVDGDGSTRRATTNKRRPTGGVGSGPPETGTTKTVPTRTQRPSEGAARRPSVAGGGASEKTRRPTQADDKTRRPTGAGAGQNGGRRSTQSRQGGGVRQPTGAGTEAKAPPPIVRVINEAGQEQNVKNRNHRNRSTRRKKDSGNGGATSRRNRSTRRSRQRPRRGGSVKDANDGINPRDSSKLSAGGGGGGVGGGGGFGGGLRPPMTNDELVAEFNRVSSQRKRQSARSLSRRRARRDRHREMMMEQDEYMRYSQVPLTTEKQPKPDREVLGTKEYTDQIFEEFVKSGKLPYFESYPRGFSWPSKFDEYTQFKDPFIPHSNADIMKIYYVEHRGRKAVLKAVHFSAEFRLEQLLDEVTMLSHLTPTPGVIQLYHVFTDLVSGWRGRKLPALCVVLEYMDGGDLLDATENGMLDENTIRPIIMDALNGLQNIHAAGFVHRDIKPDNVMMYRETPDGPLRGKVIDLGVAVKRLPGDGFRHGLTGTHGYFAPESLTDRKQNIGGDIFAFGVSVYASVIDHMPSDGDRQQRIVDEEAGLTDIQDEVKLLITLPDIAPDGRYADRITDYGKDFVRKLMDPDWEKRLRFAQQNAKDHPWFGRSRFQQQFRALNALE